MLRHYVETPKTIYRPLSWCSLFYFSPLASVSCHWARTSLIIFLTLHCKLAWLGPLSVHISSQAVNLEKYIYNRKMYHFFYVWRENAQLPIWQLLLSCYFFAEPGTIAGIAVALILLVIIILMVILFVVKLRRSNKVGCLFCRSRNVCVNNNLHFC